MRRTKLSQAVLTLLVLACCCSLPAGAEEDTQEKTEQSKKAGWKPATPTPEKFDWIQLKSGEWLKGKLISMYDENLEFDSDELDELTFDWEDVKQIRSARIMRVGFEHNQRATGKIIVEGDTLRVLGATERLFKRAEIMTIASGSSKELNNWGMRASLGGNVRQGNTEQLEINGEMRIQRRTVKNRVIIDYIGNYNVTETIETANNHRANFAWNRFLSKRLFVVPVTAEYYKDPFQNIRSRVTIGTGVGYHLIDTKKTEWRISTGPGAQGTRFDDVTAGTNEGDRTPAWTTTTTLDMELAKWMDFIWEYQFQFTNEESGQYNHHMKIGFETDITKLIDFDVSAVWDRIQNPRPDSEQNVPEQDDLRLIIGLALEF